jgi:hypothetical protein
VVHQQQVRRQQLVCDKDSMMRHLVHQCVAGMVRHSALDAVDVRQIRDEPNLDVDQTSVDEAHHFHLVY